MPLHTRITIKFTTLLGSTSLTYLPSLSSESLCTPFTISHLPCHHNTLRLYVSSRRLPPEPLHFLTAWWPDVKTKSPNAGSVGQRRRENQGCQSVGNRGPVRRSKGWVHVEHKINKEITRGERDELRREGAHREGKEENNWVVILELQGKSYIQDSYIVNDTQSKRNKDTNTNWNTIKKGSGGRE